MLRSFDRGVERADRQGVKRWQKKSRTITYTLTVAIPLSWQKPLEPPLRIFRFGDSRRMPKDSGAVFDALQQDTSSLCR